MNLLLLVEGRRTEPAIYRHWLKHAFPKLEKANTVEEVLENNYFLLSGYGYPGIVKRIQAAVGLLNDYPLFNHFFICLDAEENEPGSVKQKVEHELSAHRCSTTCTIIVADCCIETWLLGHRKMMKANPQGEELRAFKSHYDVSRDDPEAMPHHPSYVTRAQFHEDYLKAMLREQDKRYSKAHPGVTCDRSYLRALAARFQQTQHIASFGQLWQQWQRLGAAPPSI